MAAVPSAFLAVTTSDGARAVGVLVAAAAVLVAGARTGIRAPLMVGAGTALALALGFTRPGAALAARDRTGRRRRAARSAMRRERRPVGRRLVDLH